VARVAVLRFPGTNTDRDVERALRVVGLEPRLVWHGEYRAGQYDAVVIPGGFSYGDWLRAGAIAARGRAVEELVKDVEAGIPILGICNGFQILVEAGVLPGALLPNDPPRFVCRWVRVRVVDNATPFTKMYEVGEVVWMPVAHAEGRYVYVNEAPRAVFRYVDNPNGSMDDIAGVANDAGNVLGLMPHPERSTEAIVSRGGPGGYKLWLSLAEAIKRGW